MGPLSAVSITGFQCEHEVVAHPFEAQAIGDTTSGFENHVSGLYVSASQKKQTNLALQ